MLLKNICGMKCMGAAMMLSLCFLFVPFASSGTQDDIETCRTAITQQNVYDISDYRLRYISSKGKRNRVIKLEAIPNKDGERFKITCQLDRKNKVVAINDHELTKLAKK